MNFEKIARMLGLSQEEAYSALASTGAASEQHFRQLVHNGDVQSLRQLARQNKDRMKRDPHALRQARYMGASIPEDF